MLLVYFGSLLSLSQNDSFNALSWRWLQLCMDKSLKISVYLKVFCNFFSVVYGATSNMYLASTFRNRVGVALMILSKLFANRIIFDNAVTDQFFQIKLLVNCFGQCGAKTSVEPQSDVISIGTFPSRFSAKTSHFKCCSITISALDRIGSWNVIVVCLSFSCKHRMKASWCREMAHWLKRPMPMQIIFLILDESLCTWSMTNWTDL